MYFGVVWRHDREDGGESEGLFECFEGIFAFRGEVPNNSFSGQTCERNCDIGIVKDESLIEVSKSEEGLNILDFVGFRPFLDGLDLVIGH